MAFVSSFTPALRLSSSVASSSFSSRRPSNHSPIVMKAKSKSSADIAAEVIKSRAGSDARAAKIDAVFVPQRGFVKNAELLNGRLAQLGFVVGLVTELVSGKGINQQLAIIFSPISQLFN